MLVSLLVLPGVGAVGVPVKAALFKLAFVAKLAFTVVSWFARAVLKELVILVAKLASSFIAWANSFKVFNASGEFAIKLSKAAFTNAVVASCVVSVPGTAVGAVGTPVSEALFITFVGVNVNIPVVLLYAIDPSPEGVAFAPIDKSVNSIFCWDCT